MLVLGELFPYYQDVCTRRGLACFFYKPNATVQGDGGKVRKPWRPIPLAEIVKRENTTIQISEDEREVTTECHFDITFLDVCWTDARVSVHHISLETKSQSWSLFSIHVGIIIKRHLPRKCRYCSPYIRCTISAMQQRLSSILSSPSPDQPGYHHACLA